MGKRHSRRWLWWALLILIVGCGAGVGLTLKSFTPVPSSSPLPAAVCSTTTLSEPFVAGGEGFSAAFPCLPTRTTAAANTPFGKIEVVTYEAAYDDANYAVSFVDYGSLVPGGDLPPVLVSFILDGARRGVLRSAGMNEPTITDIQTGEYVGQAIRAENAEKTLHGRIYIVGQTTYQIVIVTRKDRPADDAVSRYLDSFKALPR